MKVGEVLASRKGADTLDVLKQFFLVGYFTYSYLSKKSLENTFIVRRH